MRAYSEDLRRKVVQALERGMSKSQAARLFGISLSSVKRYARDSPTGESPSPPGKEVDAPPKPTSRPRSFSKRTYAKDRRLPSQIGATS